MKIKKSYSQYVGNHSSGWSIPDQGDMLAKFAVHLAENGQSSATMVRSSDQFNVDVDVWASPEEWERLRVLFDEKKEQQRQIVELLLPNA